MKINVYHDAAGDDDDDGDDENRVIINNSTATVSHISWKKGPVIQHLFHLRANLLASFIQLLLAPSQPWLFLQQKYAILHISSHDFMGLI